MVAICLQSCLKLEIMGENLIGGEPNPQRSTNDVWQKLISHAWRIAKNLSIRRAQHSFKPKSQTEAKSETLPGQYMVNLGRRLWYELWSVQVGRKNLGVKAWIYRGKINFHRNFIWGIQNMRLQIFLAEGILKLGGNSVK